MINELCMCLFSCHYKICSHYIFTGMFTSDDDSVHPNIMLRNLEQHASTFSVSDSYFTLTFSFVRHLSLFLLFNGEVPWPFCKIFLFISAFLCFILFCCSKLNRNPSHKWYYKSYMGQWVYGMRLWACRIPRVLLSWVSSAWHNLYQTFGPVFIGKSHVTASVRQKEYIEDKHSIELQNCLCLALKLHFIASYKENIKSIHIKKRLCVDQHKPKWHRKVGGHKNLLEILTVFNKR